MDTTFVRGLIPALIPPMTCDEALDEAGLGRLLKYVTAAAIRAPSVGQRPESVEDRACQDGKAASQCVV